jgi:hypothetical protein
VVLPISLPITNQPTNQPPKIITTNHLQNRTYSRWNPNPKISNETIRLNWDPSKSPTINLANMGLVAEPNQLNRNPPAAGHHQGDSDQQHQTKKDVVIALFDIPDSDQMGGNKKGSKQRLPLNKDEQQYIAKCMAKHGEDYPKMFRDIKLNNMQHTEEKLRKMGARFLLLDPQQRLVDLPNYQPMTTTR